MTNVILATCILPEKGQAALWALYWSAGRDAAVTLRLWDAADAGDDAADADSSLWFSVQLL